MIIMNRLLSLAFLAASAVWLVYAENTVVASCAMLCAVMYDLGTDVLVALGARGARRGV